MANDYRHHANPALSQGLHEIARSGAAGTHLDKRTKRNRSRSAQRTNAIKDARD